MLTYTHIPASRCRATMSRGPGASWPVAATCSALVLRGVLGCSSARAAAHDQHTLTKNRFTYYQKKLLQRPGGSFAVWSAGLFFRTAPAQEHILLTALNPKPSTLYPKHILTCYQQKSVVYTLEARTIAEGLVSVPCTAWSAGLFIFQGRCTPTNYTHKSHCSATIRGCCTEGHIQYRGLYSAEGLVSDSE